MNGKQCKQKKRRVWSDVHPGGSCLLLHHSAMQFVACNPYNLFPLPLNMPHVPGCSQSTVSSRTALEGEDHEVHWIAP